MDPNDSAHMTSSPHPPQIEAIDTPTLAPELVGARVEPSLAKPENDSKVGVPNLEKGVAAANASAPTVDTTFRAAATGPAKKPVDKPAKTRSAKNPAKPSFGRRLVRGAVGMILTACVAGGAVLWQSHGDAVRQIFTKSVAPIVVALLSRESPADVQPSAVPSVEAATVPLAPSAPAIEPNNVASAAAGSSPEQTELLQSIARDLSSLRQDVERMKASVAELKAGQDQLSREVARASDKATDKALEQALRPRVSMVSPPVAAPARKPPPPVARAVQSRAAPAYPSAPAYMPRQAELRAVAPPPPQSAAAPPIDLSAPRPPAPLREQTP